MRSKRLETFSTSFLDLLSCGLGAVILLYILVSSLAAAGGSNRGDGLSRGERIAVHIEVDGNDTVLGCTVLKNNHFVIGSGSFPVNGITISPNRKASSVYDISLPLPDSTNAVKQAVVVWRADIKAGPLSKETKIRVAISRPKAGSKSLDTTLSETSPERKIDL